MTEINIKDFGGKGDGVFDNTNSFKAAFFLPCSDSDKESPMLTI